MHFSQKKKKKTQARGHVIVLLLQFTGVLNHWSEYNSLLWNSWSSGGKRRMQLKKMSEVDHDHEQMMHCTSSLPWSKILLQRDIHELQVHCSIMWYHVFVWIRFCFCCARLQVGPSGLMNPWSCWVSVESFIYDCMNIMLDYERNQTCEHDF